MSGRNRNSTRAILLVAVAATLLSLLAVVGQVIRSRSRAEAFLKDGTGLQLRLATLSQVQQLSARYGGHIEPGTCDPHGCAYFFSFDNGWLQRLRLAPYTRFTCTLGVADGILVYRRAVLATANKGLDFGVFVEEWLSYPKGLQSLKEPFDIRRQPAGASADVRWRVHVNLTADATPNQHSAAYSFNLKCLSRIGGCQDAQQMLPSVRWSADGSALHALSVLVSVHDGPLFLCLSSRRATDEVAPPMRPFLT